MFFFFSSKASKLLKVKKKKKEVVAIYTRRNRFIKDGGEPPAISITMYTGLFGGRLCVLSALTLRNYCTCVAFLKTVPEKAPRVVVASASKETCGKIGAERRGVGDFKKKKKKIRD